MQDSIEVIHSQGGWQFTNNYPRQHGDGTVNSIGFQYTFSLAAFMLRPQAWWGQGTDFTVQIFGMYTWISGTGDVLPGTYFAGITGTDGLGTKKLKMGTQLLYTPLPVMSVGARFDWVQPNMDNSAHTFWVISPRLIFHTAFVTHEQIIIQYQYYDYGSWYSGPTTVGQRHTRAAMAWPGLPYPYGQAGNLWVLCSPTSTPSLSPPACGGSPIMRAVLPALLLPLAVGCVPIGARTAPPGRGSESDDSAGSGAGAAGTEDLALSPHNLIANATFADGTSLPWTSSFTAPAAGSASVVDGALCLEVTNRGRDNWDAQLRHREMTIQKGHKYSISFVAYATQPTTIRPKVGMQGPPYAEYWFQEIKLDTTPRRFKAHFRKSGPDDPTAEFTFHVGGSLARDAHGTFSVCIDDVRLEDSDFVRPAKSKAAPPANVLVNQVGYFPGLVKLATVRTGGGTPQPWRLVDGAGREVKSGQTQVAGTDALAGDTVQIADFTSFEREGRGFAMVVGSDRSHPFDISPTIYHKLKYDALAFYYHNRSGIEIVMPYAGGPQWTRPAGHLSDKSVPCAAGSGCSLSLGRIGRLVRRRRSRQVRGQRRHLSVDLAQSV